MSFIRSAGPYLLGAGAMAAVLVSTIAASTYAVFGIRSSDSWLEFLLFTAILFGCIAYGYRKLFERRMFWVLYALIFAAHCAGWLLTLKETGPWRTRAAIGVTFAELVVAVLVLTSVFRVAPTMGSSNMK